MNDDQPGHTHIENCNFTGFRFPKEHSKHHDAIIAIAIALESNSQALAELASNLTPQLTGPMVQIGK